MDNLLRRTQQSFRSIPCCIRQSGQIHPDTTTPFHLPGFSILKATSGQENALSLFKYEGTDSFNFDGAVAAINKELGINKNQIDSFLKNYIRNFGNN